MSKFRERLAGRAPAGAALILTALPFLPAPAAAEPLGLGRAALPEEIAAWNLDVAPDGTGLHEGSGSVADGETLFSDRCAVCHGEFGEAVGRWPRLAGGQDTLADADPDKTIGSYWPYLSTAWDYIHRSMPFGDAQTLSPDETYAIVAYLLNMNDIVDDNFVLSKANFLSVEMPNRDGFIEDDRDTVELPKFTVEPCMDNCKATVEITKHATNLDVTPGSSDDDPAQAGAGLEGGAPPEAAGDDVGAAEPPSGDGSAPAAAPEGAAAPAPEGAASAEAAPADAADAAAAPTGDAAAALAADATAAPAADATAAASAEAAPADAKPAAQADAATADAAAAAADAAAAEATAPAPGAAVTPAAGAAPASN